MIDNTIISISIIILASFVFILSMKGELFGGYNKKSILNDLNSSGIKFPKKFRVISCEDISKVWREPSEKTTIEFYSNFDDNFYSELDCLCEKSDSGWSMDEDSNYHFYIFKVDHLRIIQILHKKGTRIVKCQYYQQ